MSKPQREELAACHAENQQLLDDRDVYCVKEYGRPNNTWEWVFGTLFIIAGASAWIGGNVRADKLEKQAAATKAKADALLAEAKKKAAENVVTLKLGDGKETINGSRRPENEGETQ